MKINLFDDINLNTKSLSLVVQNQALIDNVLDYYKSNSDFHFLAFPTLPYDFLTDEFQNAKLMFEIDKMINNQAIRFFAFKKDDIFHNEIIGEFLIFNIELYIKASCEIGFTLNQNYIKKGFMTEILTEMIKFISDELELERVVAYTLEENVAAISILEKFGFQKECLARKFMSHNNKLKDYLQFALIL